MFTLKKIITFLILPPGLFIVLALLLGLRMLRRRVKYGVWTIGLAFLIYLMSIPPVGNSLMGSLEREWSIPEKVQGDVIVLLGGGVYSGVPDISGRGFPSSSTLSRMLMAVRIQHLTGAPIIISGGRVYGWGDAEAEVAGRIMKDLGVPADRLIMEDKSRDTMENARAVKEICQREGWRQPILVTSAWHMRRSLIAFRKAGMEPKAFPADFLVDPHRSRHWTDFQPDMGALSETATAMHEYLGILYYWLAYGR
jgi:uncharacterized SAM-binding protein YcdF (DUF218 family)